MIKKLSLGLEACEIFAKYSIYAAIFLLPLLFFPWTSEVLEFNKQTLLILLGTAALFFWMLTVLISGKFKINVNKIHIAVGVLFLAYLSATIFSVNRYGSFWGWPQITSESLLSLIGLLVFYFLVSNTFSKKEVLNSIIIFIISASIAQIIGILQMFRLFIIPFSFAQSVSFNTIGSAGSLGFLSAILLPIATVMLIESKKWWKILFVLQLFASALILFSLNYPIIWWTVLAGSAFLIIFGLLKKNLFDGRWLALPMFFLAVSLFFILVNIQIPLISQKSNEVALSQNASFNISLQAIKSRPISGSGLGTFSYDFLKFKNPGFSQSSLWNAIFSQPSSKVLNDLASAGILGLFALFAFMALVIFSGIKFLVSDKKIKENDESNAEVEKYWLLTLGILTALIMQFISYFLYDSNLTLAFLNFILVAAMVNLITHKKREYELKPSSWPTLLVAFMFTMAFIFGFGLLILDGQRYVAEINYSNGLSYLQSQNIDEGIKSLELAASLNPNSDIYFVQLSHAYLLSLQNELNNSKAVPTDAEKIKIQTLISNAVNSAKIATDLNPSSYSDWANRGYIYQSLDGIIGDSSSWSLSSYGSALNLNPNNPYVLSQEGIVNYTSAQQLGSDKPDQKNQFLSAAKSQLMQAVSLNPNYSNGLYFLGLVYDATGDKTDAIKEFTILQELNPKDANIQKILGNLNAGLPALQQQAPPATTPPPTSDNSSSSNSSSPSKTPAKATK